MFNGQEIIFSSVLVTYKGSYSCLIDPEAYRDRKVLNTVFGQTKTIIISNMSLFPALS